VPPFVPHVDVLLILGSAVAAFLIWARRHERETGEATPAHNRRLFLSGMAVLFATSLWPMHDVAEQRWYSAHMVQHMSFTLVAAPLLVTGIPAWMWRSVLRPAAVARVWRFATRPVMALAISSAVLLFTHWPAVVEISVRSEPIHFALHALLLLSALIMWWPVFSPLPEMPPATAPVQMLYLFAQSLAPTIPASFLTFGHAPLYKIYETFPRMFGLPALTDQLIAGLLMKIVGGLILWGYIAVIFFRWHDREVREGWDATALRDVDASVRAGVGR
jgi:putative membrane protein